jgi:hypothetical protein
MFARMFEMGRLPYPEELGFMDDAELTGVLAVASSMERLAQAYRMHLTDRLYRRQTVPARPPTAATSPSRSSRRRRRKARKRRRRR